VHARASRVLLGGLLLACAACGGSDRGGDELAIYHLEAAIGPPGTAGELRCGPPRLECPGVLQQPPQHDYHYVVRKPPALTGDDILRDSVRTIPGTAAGEQQVTVALTSAGRRAFARLTREVARTGGRDQGWHHVAVVVGDEIVAFPEIDFDVYPDGIPNAPAIQFPAARAADADDLVERLRGG
jgi:preprotein translocase subunit SecD